MRRWLAWALAALAGAAAAWGALRLTAEAVLAADPLRGLVLQALAVPLAAVAGFALTWNLAAGRPLRGRFWAVAVPAAFLVWGAGFAVAFAGLATVTGSAGLMAALATLLSLLVPLRA